MKRWGLTLVEVLVATALLGLLTTMIASALVMAWRTYHLDMTRVTGYRKAMDGLDRMRHRLAICQALYGPPPSTAFVTPTYNRCDNGPHDTVFHPLVTQSPLIFGYNSYQSQTPAVVGYVRDPQGRTVIEQQFGASWAPGAQPTASVVVAENIDDFIVTHHEPTFGNGMHLLELQFVFTGGTVEAPSTPTPLDVVVPVILGAP